MSCRPQERRRLLAIALLSFKEKLDFKSTVNQLVDQIKSGDNLAKEEFVKVLTPFLAKSAKKLRYNLKYNDILSSINWVLTKVINNIDTLDQQKNIVSYISNAVRNFCIDEYRKLSVRKRKEADYKSMKEYSNLGIENTISFVLEDLSRNETEFQILSKIVIEKKNSETISSEMNIPITEINSLFERVKEELIV